MGLSRVSGSDGLPTNTAPTDGTLDEGELKLLVKVFGTMKSRRGRAYNYTTRDHVTHYRTSEYVMDRNAFFGSEDAYWEYLGTCQSELDADDAALRRHVEPPIKQRRKVARWREAQDVFYAWVRKAYEKKLGADVDVPAIIRSRMSESLKAALKQVQIDYGHEFAYGGFNPRPMKLNGYKLGTLSDHALGNALDIESGSNPHLEEKEWTQILGFTGKTLDHRTRQTLWRTAPKQLHDSIVEINTAFVAQLAAAVQAARVTLAANQAAAPAASANSKPKPAAASDAVAIAVKQDAHLKALGENFVRKWQNGFFNLPWALVKELHEEGFTWGATFGDPDLHHFEL